MSDFRLTIVGLDEDAALNPEAASKWQGIAVSRAPGSEAFLQRPMPDFQDCILVDSRLGGLRVAGFVDSVRRQGCQAPIVVVVAQGDVRGAADAIRAGAHDIIERPIDLDELLARVRGAITSGQSISARPRDGTFPTRLDSLTPRELDVARLLTLGETNKQIAHVLGISEKTVEYHRARVMQKMRATPTAQLIRRVVGIE